MVSAKYKLDTGRVYVVAVHTIVWPSKFLIKLLICAKRVCPQVTVSLPILLTCAQMELSRSGPSHSYADNKACIVIVLPSLIRRIEYTLSRRLVFSCDDGIFYSER